MSEHCDRDRIARCMAGEGNEADLAHVESCAECRRERDEFTRVLRGVRGAVRRWSDEELVVAAGTMHRPVAGTAWTLAIVVIFCLLGLRMSLPRKAEGVAVTVAVATETDSELFAQVRADLERPVPRGMEPLLP